MRAIQEIETSSGAEEISKTTGGGRRSYLAAHARNSETGSIVTYSRSSESTPEKWQEMQQEIEELYRSPYLEEAGLEQKREAEVSSRLEKIEQRIGENRSRAERDARESRALGLTTETRDSRARRILEDLEEIEAETEAEENYSISIGLGDMTAEDLARSLAEEIAGGAEILPAFGIWEGTFEYSARVNYSGTRRGLEEILRAIADLLPREETALVTSSSGGGSLEFEELNEYRSLKRLEEYAKISASISRGSLS